MCTLLLYAIRYLFVAGRLRYILHRFSSVWCLLTDAAWTHLTLAQIAVKKIIVISTSGISSNPPNTKIRNQRGEIRQKLRKMPLEIEIQVASAPECCRDLRHSALNLTKDIEMIQELWACSLMPLLWHFYKVYCNRGPNNIWAIDQQLIWGLHVVILPCMHTIERETNGNLEWRSKKWSAWLWKGLKNLVLGDYWSPLTQFSWASWDATEWECKTKSHPRCRALNA